MNLNDIGNALVNASQTPLFQFGMGIANTPYQRMPYAPGQVLANGFQQMDQSVAAQRAAAAMAQSQQAQAQQKQQSDALQQAILAARLHNLQSPQPAASGRPFLIGGRLVSPSGQLIYTAPPATGPYAGAKLPAGYTWNQAHTGAVPIPGLPQATNFQGGGNTPLPGNADLSGQDYINSINDPGARALALSYLSGNNPPPSGTALKNSAIRSAWTAALHADPTLSTGTYTTRLKNREAFIDGKQGQIINRMNTAIGHLGEYIDQVDQLDEGGFKPLNAISNFGKGQIGNTTLSQINTIVPNLASEIAYVYNGGVPAEGEVNERESAFNPNLGKKANVANAVQTIKLLQSKLDALQSQYAQGAGTFAEPLTMVNPQARQAEAQLRALSARLGIDTGTPGSTAAMSNAASASASNRPQIGAVEDGYKFKGGDPADPKNWIKQ